MYLVESENLIAVIPVFKLAENKQELNKYYESNKKLNKEQKKYVAQKKREEKFQQIIAAKYPPAALHCPFSLGNKKI